MYAREFWRDTKRKDEIWAVELCEDRIFRCCGPFTEGEVDEEMLDSLDFSVTRAPWLEERRERFQQWQPPVTVIWPT